MPTSAARVRAKAPRSTSPCPVGADTHSSDPISSFALERADYVELAGRIASLGVRTLIVMEGGYAVGDLGKNVAAFLSGFED